MILISLDSVRADDLTFLNEDATPVLAELARSGVAFEHVVSGSSWTLPTHAQMFTGQPPVLHGVQGDSIKIDPLTTTLPEVLSRAGYATAGFWSGWYLAGDYGFARGFDRYESALQKRTKGADPDKPKQFLFLQERSSHRQITSERIVSMARETLEEVPADEPLFLFAHFFDPHYDYIPEPPFDRKFDPDYAGDMDGRDFWTNKRVFDDEKKPPRQISDRDLRHIRALYRGEIAWTDSCLGELFSALDAAGRLDNAIIVVTADHGEEFFEHGNRGHRQTLYEESIRVPLLIVAPGLSAEGETEARTSDVRASLSDILPTVADLAGLEVPASSWGRSLRPVLEGQPSPGLEDRVFVSSLATLLPGEDGRDETWILDSLHTGNEKLKRQIRIAPDGSPEVRGMFWYDLTQDPAEAKPKGRNLSPAVESTWRRFESETARLRAFHSGLPHSAPAERHTGVREIFASELGALGYAENEGESEILSVTASPWLLVPTPALELPK